MDIHLKDLSKRFDENFVLRKFNYQFNSNGRYAIQGANGSGKSTLLKIISGHLTPSLGQIEYLINAEAIKRGEIYRHLSFTAPYIDLIEDFNLKEIYDYHSSFKKLKGISSLEEFREVLDYEEIKPLKLIHNYSSGMKNRLKLALHVLTDADVLLLDEPSSFLDADGVEWFQKLLKSNLEHKTLIIASNDAKDFEHCDKLIEIKSVQS